MTDALRLPDETYTRSLKPFHAACDDLSFILERLSNKPKAEVKRFVGETVKTRMVNPRTRYYEQVVEGKREEVVSTLFDYLREVDQRDLIMVGTFTTYVKPEIRVSLAAKYVEEKIKARKINKDIYLEHKSKQNTFLAEIYNNRQQRNKILGNTPSGISGAKSSIWTNPTTHSTLTVICRSGSNTTNAEVERMLAGNYIYHDPETALINIANVARRNSGELTVAALAEYNLAIPTTDEIYRMVEASLLNYCEPSPKFKRIYDFISALTPVEKAAYYYTGNLWAVREANPEFIERMLMELIDTGTEVEIGDGLKGLDGDDIILSKVILRINDLKAPEVAAKVNGLGNNFRNWIAKYELFFKAFILTPCLAPNMGRMPEASRKAVIGSDTDSCLFTTQDWTSRYAKVGDPKRLTISAAVVYIMSVHVAQCMCVMSGNFNVSKKHLRHFEMKNEYLFPIFINTTMAKHYLANMVVQEGKILPTFGWEIKGAHIINSSVSKEYMSVVTKTIKEVITHLNHNDTIELYPYIRKLRGMELEIKERLTRADRTLLPSKTIKGKNSYGTENSPYLHYELWETVFAPKYGHTPEPPYSSVKVPCSTDTKAKMNAWLASLDDPAMVERIRAYMAKYNKDCIATYYIPSSVTDVKGVPTELVGIMRIPELIMSIIKPFYFLLEGLGYYAINSDLTRMLHLLPDDAFLEHNEE